MEAIEIKNHLEKLGAEIDAKVEKANGQANEAGTVAKEVRDELKALTEKYQAFEAKMNRAGRGGFDGESSETIGDMLAKSAEYKSLASTKRGNVSFELKATQLKPAVGASAVIDPQRVGGLYMQPLSLTHMRQVLAAGTTTSDSIRSISEEYYTSNAKMVAEGTDKPEDAFKLKSEDVPVRTLATLIRVSNQMLADIPYIQSYIVARGSAKMDRLLDSQILYGTGEGEDLLGLTHKAQAFAKPVGLKVKSANAYDVLVAAMLQIRIAEYGATAVVLNPVDVTNLMLEKDTQGRYLFPGLQAAAKNINGVPVVENTTIQAGKYFVGDFKLAAALYQREGLKIEFFDQDRDNVQKNLTTIRIEQRMALPVFVPQAFLYGDFEATLTALAA